MAKVSSRIEVREFSILSLATHQFLVKYNEDGSMTELHGVAVNKVTRKFNSLAIGQGNLLKVAAYPPIPDHPSLTIKGFKSLYQDNQGAKTLFAGSEEEVNARWNAAIRAAEKINALNSWDYDLSGGGEGKPDIGNSNSVTATLENIMGFTAVKIGKQSTPGLEKNLLPAASVDYANLYNPAWGNWGAYEPDPMDKFGASVASAAAGDLSQLFAGMMGGVNTMDSLD